MKEIRGRMGISNVMDEIAFDTKLGKMTMTETINPESKEKACKKRETSEMELRQEMSTGKYYNSSAEELRKADFSCSLDNDYADKWAEDDDYSGEEGFADELPEECVQLY
mmetsp:Transcript_29405/g.21866  ORF Transcript_29405/g.21866 Transcript_29405/m.21866 type:complete len:110 (+) Transcript_29405:354-683(+)|eukprot:CAMPEP_0202959896 /NCGR_PEP_ID=MMETSP1396-20130829/4083_1 /ASSEMBLY_ACC=CAM_ASM_000872 /TAXON_ID= /ORGANISM="Pseudokeronopsis sp., Strain Brazil" /LENGTH=109 /DNA_ID=CAMNT_0049678761 /DNA_START=347 /DNA_END=676 /DNA_ORIENTATION=-